MTTWIWKDHPFSLRVAVIAVSILLLLAAAGRVQSWYASSGAFLLSPSLALLFAASSYGMLRMMSWARWLAVVILWILIFVLVGGIINPYMASDIMSAGIKPPSVATLLAYIVPAVTAIVWVLHILGKYKRRFE